MRTKRTVMLSAVVVSVAAMLAATTQATAATSGIELLTVSAVGNAGSTGNDGTSTSAISGDGRYVVLLSSATDLLPSNSPFYSGFIFLRDRLTHTTTPVALNNSGEYANDGASYAAINGNGRYIAFSSIATNLAAGDIQGTEDIFIRDLQAKTTTLISKSGGVPANGDSEQTAIDTAGRFVAYISDATNLVTGDTNGVADVFVYDRANGTTRRANLSSSGQQANAAAIDPAISGNGRYVSFWSAASNLVPGDTNGVQDAFVRDLRTGTTTRVTVSSNGAQGNAGRGVYSFGAPALSSNGRYVAFASAASNLVPGDTNKFPDIFLRDLVTGTTTLLSRTAGGGLGNGEASAPSISADGRYVAYSSEATNLVPGDTNGVQDIFVQDVRTGQVTRQNNADNGDQANILSFGAHLSGNGRVLAFTSGADNLVPEDYNDEFDIFARQLR